MNIKQVKTSACQTIYEIKCQSETYRLRLYVVSGTPVLAFEDNLGSKRFSAPNEVQGKWSDYDYARRCFPHQDPQNIQGPTYDEVLPNGLDDLVGFLDEFGPKHAQAIAEAQEREKLRAYGLPPRNKWPRREPEPESRTLKGRQRPDGGWVLQGRDVTKVLKGVKDAVHFGNIVFEPSLLRQYAEILKSDWLIVYPANGDGRLCIQTADGRNRTTIKNGARDKYHGLNGFNARVILVNSV